MDPGDDITLFGLDDRPGWETAIAGSGLPSHSWAYAWGLAAEGYVPQLAVIRSGGARMILPFHERSWQGRTDIATLPGLSGAMIEPVSTAPIALWRDYAARRGWVCGYIQLAVGAEGLACPPPDTILAHNALFVFDLDHWDPQHSVSRNMRRTLRARADLVTDRDRLHSVFAGLNAQAMARAGTSAEFGPAAIERWFEDPGTVAFGAEVEGRIEAVHLGRTLGEWAELHLAGSSQAGRSLQAWLIAAACANLRSRGVRFVNIGGYGHAGDGLHRMKQRFNIAQHPLRALRQIYRPAEFEALCRQAGAAPAAHYFPPYRAPAAWTQGGKTP